MDETVKKLAKANGIKTKRLFTRGINQEKHWLDDYYGA